MAGIAATVEQILDHVAAIECRVAEVEARMRRPSPPAGQPRKRARQRGTQLPLFPDAASPAA